METLDQILVANCYPKTSLTWEKWLEILRENGVIIMNDDSGFKLTDIVLGADVPEVVKKCTIRFKPKEVSVQEWREEFHRLSNCRPVEGEILVTNDGDKVKLCIELATGKEPFIFARAYIPNKVGDELGWYAQSFKDNSNYGLKVILYPQSRNNVIRKLGIAKNEVAVTSIRILRGSESGQSLLGEICEW